MKTALILFITLLSLLSFTTSNTHTPLHVSDNLSVLHNTIAEGSDNVNGVVYKTINHSFLDEYIERTVLIKITCNGTPRGWGTGVEIGKGKIVTAAHVVDNKCDIMVSGHKVIIVKLDTVKDVAILKSTRKLTKVRLRIPDLGEKIVCVGYSKQYFPKYKATKSVTYGNVSTIGLPRGLMRITNQVNSGHSGGGCFSLEDGALVGIVISLHSDRHNTPIVGYSYLRPPNSSKK